jgi:hypothetical protein
MLREICDVRQVPGEPKRRWFSDETLDLIVWLDERQEILGFQLCYDKTGNQRALTWRRDGGYSHQRVDDGEWRPGKYKQSPILLADGRCDMTALAAEFSRRAQSIEPAIVAFVQARLGQAGPAEPPAPP